MAVGNDDFPLIYPIPGFRLGTACAGIKKPGRKDLVVMEIHPAGTIAGAFTQNAFCAAPVKLAKQCLQSGKTRYLVTNTGNANAGTGEQGMQDALQVCRALAEQQVVAVDEVAPFSTGVIGEPLPVEKITTGLPVACELLSENGWTDAAEGILTTDTRPKGASVQVSLSGSTVTISGIAKGSGMIKPNMATMLSYVATDLAVEAELLQQWVREMVDASFNRITVDGDTSTNDSAVLVATGQSGVEASALCKVDRTTFLNAMRTVYVDLAQQIIKDGEGATKFVTVAVEAGLDSAECLSVAYAVAESPLVKTALFASDPNWGRILAAVGRAGPNNFNVDTVQIYLDDLLIADQGGRAPGYTEEQGQAVMDKDCISIRICLNRGQAAETVWTTDLSYDYIKINAEYRT